jgi:hypothetical protein
LRLHDLKRHQKLHTGERPYHCPVCKRSFSRLDALNRHRKTEGGSACHKKSLSSSSSAITPLFIPTMTSQWQSTITTTTTTTKPNNNTSSSSASPPTLPSLILPLDQDELVDNLRQRIHDLEIEVNFIICTIYIYIYFFANFI